jgi:maltose alpha-D-glucosyltransferase/alpha-amylase
MAIEDLWYKNAVVYCLDVETYMDSNGDGIGDFEGLSRRLEYLAGLGVTCLWLQPFYSSPNRDNGYDVSDYYGVHPKHGSLGDFVQFMNHARALGLRVILDLVVNHTSREHPWFLSARKEPRSRFRDWYVWSDTRPRDHDTGMVFPGVQKTTWTYDKQARKYFFHRFYNFQPDLDTHNPWVRDEILKIMGFWLELGISGFRMDAVPFLIEKKGAGVEHVKDFDLLREMRRFLQWREGSAILLAEANVPPDESNDYFGSEGDRLQMMLNFPVNQRLYYALATGDTRPLAWALEQTRDRPQAAQWVNFLRSHDELDLGRLTDEQRAKVFEAFGPEKRMQLYNRGIRRRFAPMMGNDRRRLELAFSLLLSLPGTPMLQYGDEIGIGEDLALPERECARTPMQWTGDRRGGFTKGRPFRPLVSEPEFAPASVNVAQQRRDPQSLLNWTERMIRTRKECPEIGWGSFKVLPSGSPEVLVLRYDWRRNGLVTLHNFADARRKVVLKLEGPDGRQLVDVFAERHSSADNGAHEVALPPYGWRWFRTGVADSAINRVEIDLGGQMQV